ncbi:four helix bundle protein [Thioalkalivibrio denitrificans]|uniref:Four helix bundle protein n=1 Tax=Thioalkalivibrio denitrificans TaxID=108003 RepID=A0A1V3NR83_9GAMM|nr:four helix bundle protein [Thioalkalivibrio denitrificans]OOG27625.1 four helix bundle protein [Thioalkalivibrio denitrificans]
MEDLESRTKRYALAAIRVYRRLPGDSVGRVLGRQLLRSGTSVGAHYREAKRARSTAEFVAKIGGGLQELEETRYWCELLDEACELPSSHLKTFLQETDELIAILTQCAKNARHRSGMKAKGPAG